MGYTHYWNRTKRLDARPFKAWIKDAQIIVETINDYGVLLAGPDGEGLPIVDATRIAFNGQAKCGHVVNTDIVIPWPTRQEGEDAVIDECFANARTSYICEGDCSFESFIVPRVLKPEAWQQPDGDKFFGDFCKTEHRAYDLAVTAVLLAAKHHFGEAFQVSSDGDDKLWKNAKRLCFSRLGYGPEYRMKDEGLVKDSNVFDAMANAILDQRRRLQE